MEYLLHHAFHQCVMKQPSAPAIIFEGRGVTTYKELNNKANMFCAAIEKIIPTTASGHTLIGVLSNVNPGSIASVFGILKAGRAYVPVDTLYSAAQLENMLEETGMTTLIADRFMLEKHYEVLIHSHLKALIIFGDDSTAKIYSLQAGELTLTHDGLTYDPDCLKTGNPPSDSLAYVLHTSGSTGTPKGIMLSHRNALTFVRWMQKEFHVTPQDRVISRAPLKFDLSVFDIFNTLSAGATLICFDWDRERVKGEKHADYVNLLENEQATIIYTTPSTLITLMEKGRLFVKETSLRTIMYAGEPFPVAKLQKLVAMAPNINIANIYGPTETNIITCHWVNNGDLENNSIPLGIEVDDTEILVVAENGQDICKPDQVGEIWCRGGTVTLGYLNQPELTARCLVRSPFHPYPAFFWRTGDFAFRDANGILHYKGRRDHIYKVNGYRIEIGEIEEATAKLAFVHESCVVVKKEQGQNIIVCHYSLIEGACFDLTQAKKILNRHLQSFKIPHRFIYHHELPKTSSGKVDRTLLQIINQ